MRCAAKADNQTLNGTAAQKLSTGVYVFLPAAFDVPAPRTTLA